MFPQHDVKEPKLPTSANLRQERNPKSLPGEHLAWLQTACPSASRPSASRPCGKRRLRPGDSVAKVVKIGSSCGRRGQGAAEEGDVHRPDRLASQSDRKGNRADVFLDQTDRISTPSRRRSGLFGATRSVISSGTSSRPPYYRRVSSQAHFELIHFGRAVNAPHFFPASQTTLRQPTSGSAALKRGRR